MSTDAQGFFIQQSIAVARSLSLPDAITYLRGLMLSVGDESGFEPIRALFVALSETDRQLELIQTGQMKLNFDNLAAERVAINHVDEKPHAERHEPSGAAKENLHS